MRRMICTAALVALVVPACAGRARVQARHGEHSARWWVAQRVHESGSTERVEGLDSEEAAAIHGEYRAIIGQGSSAPVAEPRVLILDESSSSGKSSKRK